MLTEGHVKQENIKRAGPQRGDKTITAELYVFWS